MKIFSGILILALVLTAGCKEACTPKSAAHTFCECVGADLKAKRDSCLRILAEDCEEIRVYYFDMEDTIDHENSPELRERAIWFSIDFMNEVMKACE